MGQVYAEAERLIAKVPNGPWRAEVLAPVTSPRLERAGLAPLGVKAWQVVQAGDPDELALVTTHDQAMAELVAMLPDIVDPWFRRALGLKPLDSACIHSSTSATRHAQRVAVSHHTLAKAEGKIRDLRIENEKLKATVEKLRQDKADGAEGPTR